MSEVSTADKPPNLAETSPDFEGLGKQRMTQIKRELEALAYNPGWRYLTQVLSSQAQMRLQALAGEQPFSMREVVQQALFRGEASALQLLTSYPEFLISALEAELQRQSPLEEEDEEEDD